MKKDLVFILASASVSALAASQQVNGMWDIFDIAFGVCWFANFSVAAVGLPKWCG